MQVNNELKLVVPKLIKIDSRIFLKLEVRIKVRNKESHVVRVVWANCRGRRDLEVGAWQLWYCTPQHTFKEEGIFTVKGNNKLDCR